MRYDGWRRWIPSAWALPVCAVLLTACGGEGYLMHAITGGDKVPAVYELEDRSTLIFVDDPRDVFADPNLALTVAVNIEHHFKRNKVLAGKVVPAARLADLKASRGEQFNRMPIDEVGRELDAEQVLYVLVEEASLEQAPGAFRPTAVVQVKVIDAATGKRMFPNPPAPNAPPATEPVRGHVVRTEMRYQQSRITQSAGDLTMMKRQLAEVLGRDVARQFYRWKPPEIGSRFDEP